MSDSVRPQRRQPTRLHSPRDSPGKNTGVGSHFLLQCMKVKSESEVAQSCLTPSLETPMDRGAWYATVHGVAKGRTQLSNFTLTFTFFQALKEKKKRLLWKKTVFSISQQKNGLFLATSNMIYFLDYIPNIRILR